MKPKTPYKKNKTWYSKIIYMSNFFIFLQTKILLNFTKDNTCTCCTNKINEQ